MRGIESCEQVEEWKSSRGEWNNKLNGEEWWIRNSRMFGTTVHCVYEYG
jgi:hypothetical protein